MTNNAQVFSKQAYKKVFIEIPDLKPIRNLSFAESRKELRG